MAPQRQPPVSRAGIASLLSGFARAYFSRIEQNFGGRAREARLQVGGDQRVLRRVVVVERALADAGRGGDGVNADGADSLRIEEPVRGGEDAFYTGLCTQGLTGV